MIRHRPSGLGHKAAPALLGLLMGPRKSWWALQWQSLGGMDTSHLSQAQGLAPSCPSSGLSSHLSAPH